ncbi:MAG TPA: HAD hydrolase-like protein, partial [Chloroflexota bacterium]|nr:HAD hydrolase-like protein [Chloroflexota bacterium]
CRKPRPGLLFQAAARYSINLERSFLVGDRWRDVEAGSRAGCQTILIDYHYSESYQGCLPHFRTTSLAEAVRVILGQTAEGE